MTVAHSQGLVDRGGYWGGDPMTFEQMAERGWVEWA